MAVSATGCGAPTMSKQEIFTQTLLTACDETIKSLAKAFKEELEANERALFSMSTTLKNKHWIPKKEAISKLEGQIKFVFETTVAATQEELSKELPELSKQRPDLTVVGFFLKMLNVDKDKDLISAFALEPAQAASLALKAAGVELNAPVAEEVKEDSKSDRVAQEPNS
jgi:hypothetical protein